MLFRSMPLMRSKHRFANIIHNESTVPAMFAKIYHRFFDDILIYSKTITDYLFHLENTFQILVTGKFSLKLSKCMFAQKQLEYLGHVVAGDGVRPVPEKVQAIQGWPTLRSPRAL